VGRLLNIVNPVRHSDTPEKAAQYQVEPYVIAADVYSVEPHVGRGGWTWYTGSAGWMYRLIVEMILGIQRRGNELIINPVLPPEWDGFRAAYRFGDTTYAIDIVVDRAAESVQVWLNDEKLATNQIPLTDNQQTNRVVVKIGAA
jgi:cellobiose phosphorylase